MGMRALHDMKGTSSTVMSRLLRLSIVRVADVYKRQSFFLLEVLVYFGSLRV